MKLFFFLFFMYQVTKYFCFLFLERKKSNIVFDLGQIIHFIICPRFDPLNKNILIQSDTYWIGNVIKKQVYVVV